MNGMPALQIQHISELCLGAQKVGQSLCDPGAAGRHAPDVGFEFGDLRLDLYEQRVRLDETWIPKGNEDAARANLCLKTAASLENRPESNRDLSEQRPPLFRLLALAITQSEGPSGQL